MVDEAAGLCFGVSYCAINMRHRITWRVSLWCIVKAVNNFPHIFPTSVSHGVFEKFLPAICFNLVVDFFLFSACFNPLLLVSFDGMLQSIACSYLSLYVRYHPWFGFSTRFCFPYVHAIDQIQGIVESVQAP